MARRFNGSTHRITAETATIFNTTTGSIACAAAAWVRGAAAASIGGGIYCEGENQGGWALMQGDSPNGAKGRVFIRNAAGGTSLVSATTTAIVFDSAWHHIILTQDVSRNWKVYVDGLLDINGTYASGSFTNPPDHVRIGDLARTGEGNFLNGDIAEVATFNRNLSAAEALALASGLPASFLRPVHYWPLWGIDSPEPDIGIGTHVVGTLVGPPTFIGGGKVSPKLLTL